MTSLSSAAAQARAANAEVAFPPVSVSDVVKCDVARDSARRSIRKRYSIVGPPPYGRFIDLTYRQDSVESIVDAQILPGKLITGMALATRNAGMVGKLAVVTSKPGDTSETTGKTRELAEPELSRADSLVRWLRRYPCSAR
jgi:hypothetical protein